MNSNLNPAGWVRLVIYVISALVGVGAVVATTLGYGEVAGLLGTLAGAGAAVTGGTAVYNLPKAPDQSPTAGFDVTAVLGALPAIADAVSQYQSAPSAQNGVSALPVYQGESTGGYVGKHRVGE